MKTFFIVTFLIIAILIPPIHGELKYIDHRLDSQVFNIKEKVGIFQSIELEGGDAVSFWATVSCTDCSRVSVSIGTMTTESAAVCDMCPSLKYEWYLPGLSDFVVESESRNMRVEITRTILETPEEAGLSVIMRENSLIIDAPGTESTTLSVIIHGESQSCPAHHCIVDGHFLATLTEETPIYVHRSATGVKRTCRLTINDAKKNPEYRYPVPLTPTVMLYNNKDNKDKLNVHVGLFGLPATFTKAPHVVVVDILDYNNNFIIGSESPDVETTGLVFVIDKGPAFIINITLLLIESNAGEKGSFVAAHSSRVYEKPPVVSLGSGPDWKWWDDDTAFEQLVKNSFYLPTKRCAPWDVNYTADLVPSVNLDYKINMIATQLVISDREFADFASGGHWVVNLDGIWVIVDDPRELFWFPTYIGKTHHVQYKFVGVDEDCASKNLTIRPPPPLVLKVLPDVINGVQFLVVSNIKNLIAPTFTSMSTSVIKWVKTVPLSQIGLVALRPQYIHTYEIENVKDEADFGLSFQLPFGAYVTDQLKARVIKYGMRFVPVTNSVPVPVPVPNPRRQDSLDADYTDADLEDTESMPYFIASTDKFDESILQIRSLIDVDVGVVLPHLKQTIEWASMIQLSTTHKLTTFHLPRWGIYVITATTKADPTQKHSEFHFYSDINMNEYGVDWDRTSRGDVIVPCPFVSGFKWPIRIAFLSESIGSQQKNIHIIKMDPVDGSNSESVPFVGQQYNALSPGSYAIELSIGESNDLVPISVVNIISPIAETDSDMHSLEFRVHEYPTCRDSTDGRIQVVLGSDMQLIDSSSIRMSIFDCRDMNGDPCPRILTSASTAGEMMLTNVPFFKLMIIDLEIADMCRIQRKLSFVPDDDIYPKRFTLKYEPTCENRRLLTISPYSPLFTYEPINGVPISQISGTYDITDLPIPVQGSVNYVSKVGYGHRRECSGTASISLHVEDMGNAPRLEVESVLPIFCPESSDAQVIIAYSGTGQGQSNPVSFFHNGIVLDKKYISTRTNQLIIYDLAPGEHVFSYESPNCASRVRIVIEAKHHHDLITSVERHPGIGGSAYIKMIDDTQKFRPDMFSAQDRRFLSADFSVLTGMPNGYIFRISAIYPSEYIRHDGQMCPEPIELTAGMLYVPESPEDAKRRRLFEEREWNFLVTPLAQVIRPPAMPQDTCVYLVPKPDAKSIKLTCIPHEEIIAHAECAYAEDKPQITCVLPMPMPISDSVDGGLVTLKYLHLPTIHTITNVRKETNNFEKHYFVLTSGSKPAHRPISSSFNPPDRFIFDLHGSGSPFITMFATGFFDIVISETPAGAPNPRINACKLVRSTSTPWPTQCDLDMSGASGDDYTFFKMSIINSDGKNVFSANVQVNWVRDMHVSCRAGAGTIDFFVSGGAPPYSVFELTKPEYIRSSLPHLSIQDIGAGVHIPRIYDSSDNTLDAGQACIVNVGAVGTYVSGDGEEDEEEEEELMHPRYPGVEYSIIDVKACKNFQRRGCVDPYEYSVCVKISVPILHGTDVVAAFVDDKEEEAPIVSCVDDRLYSVDRVSDDVIEFRVMTSVDAQFSASGRVTVCMESMNARKMMVFNGAIVFNEVGQNGAISGVLVDQSRALTPTLMEEKIKSGRFPFSLLMIDARACPGLYIVDGAQMATGIYGCDGVMFSGKTVDSCGVCDGSNLCVKSFVKRMIQVLGMESSEPQLALIGNDTNTTLNETYSLSASASHSNATIPEVEGEVGPWFWFMMTVFLTLIGFVLGLWMMMG